MSLSLALFDASDFCIELGFAIQFLMKTLMYGWYKSWFQEQLKKQMAMLHVQMR